MMDKSVVGEKLTLSMKNPLVMYDNILRVQPLSHVHDMRIAIE